MAIIRMNHAVLYVRDAEKTYEFYRDVFGFRVVMEMPGAKFLQAPDSDNDHDLGLFTIGAEAGPSQAGRATVGLYHIAWEVQTLADLREIAGKLSEAGALTGATDYSTTKALYGRDPDGLEFEVCWVLPASVLTPEITDDARSDPRPRPLDLDAEKARFGGQTRGGVGISIPEPAS